LIRPTFDKLKVAAVILLVATFVVLHSAYGSPLPEPVPDPSPTSDVSRVGKPVPSPGPNPKAEANPNPLPAASPPKSNLPYLESLGHRAAGGDANFVALSANAEPMIPAPEAAAPKVDEAQA